MNERFKGLKKIKRTNLCLYLFNSYCKVDFFCVNSLKSTWIYNERSLTFLFFMVYIHILLSEVWTGTSLMDLMVKWSRASSVAATICSLLKYLCDSKIKLHISHIKRRLHGQVWHGLSSETVLWIWLNQDINKMSQNSHLLCFLDLKIYKVEKQLKGRHRRCFDQYML